MIFFNAVVQTIDAFKAFTPAFIISSGTGGPDRLDAVLHALSLPGGIRVLPHGLRGGARLDLSWSIIAAFTAFSFLTSRYWVHYDD